MSLVTRCPACSTQFKVVPDQIRIAAGWVRCGRCGEVFEASAHMLSYKQSAGATIRPLPPRPRPEPEPQPVAAPQTGGAQRVDPAPAPVEPDAKAKAQQPALLVDLDSVQPDNAGVVDFDAWGEPDADPAADALDDQPAPSFVAQVERRAFWSSRPVRALSWLMLALLLLGLVLQVAWSQRDWLAARAPGLTPDLTALCAPLRCRVQPYRYLDAIVIDSSAFNRAATDSFRFSVTLRNTADLPVASPALELTLTDALEQPLARRVFTAAELGAPPALAARGEFSHTSALTVDSAVNSSAITGYRLAAFYP